MKKTIMISAILCAAASVLHMGCRMIDGFADAYIEYTNAFWVNTLGRLSSIFPISVVEILIYLLLISFVLWVFSLFILSFRRKRSAFLIRLKKGIQVIVFLAAVIFFLFESNEDIGFYRTPFSTEYGYGSGSYSTDELKDVCTMLAEEINRYAGSADRNTEGIMICGSGVRERVRQNMMRLGEEYSWLSGWCPIPKPVFISEIMSFTNMAGIFSAYTMEANYNSDMTQYNLPFTMSHELSHVKGVLQENEANFIAYVNCRNAEDKDIRYSGVLSGWVYCGNELYKRDKAAFNEIYASIDIRARLDLKANNEFWAQYKSKVSDAATSFNDSYLKAHGQKEGTLSYDRVVDLIVSYESRKRS